MFCHTSLAIPGLAGAHLEDRRGIEEPVGCSRSARRCILAGVPALQTRGDKEKRGLSVITLTVPL